MKCTRLPHLCFEKGTRELGAHLLLSFLMDV